MIIDNLTGARGMKADDWVKKYIRDFDTWDEFSKAYKIKPINCAL
jgi:hypothetical protein